MLFLWALIGLLVGWLINLLGDALPSEDRLWPPRCTQCGTPRKPLQYSGILAYLTGQSLCGQCNARISLRWLLVEAATAALFAYSSSVLIFTPSPLLLIVNTYTAILILICVTDFEHRLILHVVSFPAIAIAAILSFITPGMNFPYALIGGSIGLVLTGAIYLGGKLFVRWQSRRGRKIDEVAFGQGDVTLMLFIGLMTGAAGVLQALALGIVLGGVVAFGIIFYGLIKRESMLYMPYAYGPYLAIAGWIVLMQNAMALNAIIH